MSMKMTFRSHRVAFLLLAATAAAIALFVLSPALAVSSNPCSPCHGSQGYSQTLSVTGGTLPTTLSVGQSATVTAVLRNNVARATRYTSLSGVSATLSSQSNHFTVASPSVSVGNLASGGSATVSWTITVVSPGNDAFAISTSASNSHQGLSFSDGILVATTVSAPPAPTPTPTSPPTPSPILTPSPAATPMPTSPPTTTPIPTIIVSPSPTVEPTLPATSSPVPSPTPIPTTQPTATPASPATPLAPNPSTSTPPTSPNTIVQPSGSPSPQPTQNQPAQPSPSTTLSPHQTGESTQEPNPTATLIILSPKPSSTVTATPTLAPSAAVNPTPHAKPYSDIISSVLLFGSAPFAALALAVAVIFNVTEPKPIQQKGLAKTAGIPHKKSNSEE